MIYYVQSSLYNQILKTDVISSGIPVTTPDGTGFSTIIRTFVSRPKQEEKIIYCETLFIPTNYTLFSKPLYII